MQLQEISLRCGSEFSGFMPFQQHRRPTGRFSQGDRQQRLQPVCGTQKLTVQRPGKKQGGNWFQNVTARFLGGNGAARTLETAEAAILEAVAGVEGRGSKGLPEEQQAAFEEAVEQLEADGGVPAPTASGQLDGRWRLLYTSKPGTNSPIQRTFTGVDAFSIFQDITLEEDGTPKIVNVVEFGSFGVLRVEADANTDSRPLPDFTPRKGAGLPLFGKSATYPPAGPNIRVDFQFSYAAFQFRALPFKIPYPVPFKLLGDETKGWIDVTYLSAQPEGIRLSRGNKGTLFVLQREGPVPEPGEFFERRAAAGEVEEGVADGG